MSAVDLAETAAGLPEAWSSRVLGMVGAACVKVLRMDELPVAEESHGDAEALLVLDGRVELEVDGMPVSVGAGELFMVPHGGRTHGPPREPRHVGDRGTVGSCG